MIVKRARDKLYFSIPAQLEASFRLLINRNFQWDCSRIHHCHRRRLQWACPPAGKLRVCDCIRSFQFGAHVQNVWSICLVGVLLFTCRKSFQSSKMQFYFQLFYKSRVSSLQINYSQSSDAVLSLYDLCVLFSPCLLVSRPAYHVVICDCKLDVITHLQMKHICAGFFFL